MRISITGATGFLGKAILHQFRKGYTPIALVRDPKKLPFDVYAKPFSLENPSEVDLSDSDVLIHNAAYIPQSWEDPSEATKCMMLNGIATLKLIEKAKEQGVKKIIYVSSGQIYEPRINSGMLAIESDSIYPIMRATYYLASKAAGDTFAAHARYAPMYAHAHKTEIIIVRPSSIYGPGMSNQGLIPRLTWKLMNNEELTVNDIGNYNVDLVYMADVAKVIWELATNKVMYNNTLNVGGENAISTWEVAAELSKLLGRPEPKHVPANGLSHLALNSGKARHYYYKPTPLKDGLRCYIESLQS